MSIHMLGGWTTIDHREGVKDMTHDAPVDSRARTDLKRYACRIFAVLSLIWALGMVPTSVGQAPQVPVSSTAETVPEVQEPIVPLPLTPAADPARVALGARLFQDVRLSDRNTMACATCHQLARGGADGMPQAKTADGTLSRSMSKSALSH
jgi:cytochrome c peroxidase